MQKTPEERCLALISNIEAVQADLKKVRDAAKVSVLKPELAELNQTESKAKRTRERIRAGEVIPESLFDKLESSCNSVASAIAEYKKNHEEIQPC